MRTTLALLATLVVAADAAPTVKSSGVRVIRETVGEGFAGLTPFNAQKKGSAMAVIIEIGDGAIIKLDTDSDGSAVTRFTDDKGTDLLLKKTGFQKDGFGSFPKISEDGKAAMVEITGGGVPAAGATSLTTEATLVLQTATQKKKIKSAPFEPKKGAKVTVGDIVLTVDDVGKPSFGDGGISIEFETSNKAIESIASTAFLDATGKELASDKAGSSKMGFGKKYTYGRSFNLEKKPAGSLVLQFEVWTDLEEIKIPIKLTTGIGG